MICVGWHMIGSLNQTYRNRLRLLAERDRFYKPGSSTLNSLGRNGLIVRTGRQDRFGREEWTITEDGRQAAVGSGLRRSGAGSHQPGQRASSQGS